MISIDSILSEKVFNRDALSNIIEWIRTKHAICLLGARQVGKTRLLFLIIKHLISKKIDKKNIFYFDLEEGGYNELFNNGPQEVLKFVNEQDPSGDKKYVFIDEIQYLDNPSNLIKLFVDHYSDKVKLFISGSSALTIKSKFKDSLVGRKMVFNINSLNFAEFLIFIGEEKLSNLVREFHLFNNFPKSDISLHSKKLLKKYYEEYLIYGGYPAVVNELNKNHKIEIINEILKTYINKDINVLFDLENINAFNKLIKLMALQIGGLVNIQNLASEVGIARQTLEKYHSILKETFILNFVNPYFSNKRKEVIKMPKVYFLDLGLRNQIIRDFRAIDLRTDIGELVENNFYRFLLFKYKDEELIKYWRNKNTSEVDFIIEYQNKLIPIEVKSSNVKEDESIYGIESFLERYNIKKSIIINRDNYINSKNKILAPYYYF